jgi:hypothetical protein
VRKYEHLAVRWTPYGCTFMFEYYHLRRDVWGHTSIWLYDETHEGFPRLALLAAPKGYGQLQHYDQWICPN